MNTILEADSEIQITSIDGASYQLQGQEPQAPPGQEARFETYSPVCNEEGLKAPGKGIAERAGNFVGHVLLVDDDKYVLEVVEQMLVVLGLEVTTFTSGREAFEVYCQQSDSFDLVALDINMAEMSGIDLLRQVREVSPQQKAVLCSGYSEDENAPYELRSGETEYIQKPFSIDDLQSAIRCFINVDQLPAVVG